jgi:GTP-binding protein LepA
MSIQTTSTKALIFDSVYDPYRGVVIYVRISCGSISKKDTFFLLSTQKELEVIECGYLTPEYQPQQTLKEGEIGYIVTGLKDVRMTRVGDTVWQKGGNEQDIKTAVPLAGYSKVTPFVFSGIFPVDASEYNLLRKSLESLVLSDSAIVFENQHSPALGHGFRCGFLGLLHMDVTRQRLEREYDLDIIFTAPHVSYKMKNTKNEIHMIESPLDFPEVSDIQQIFEPIMNANIFVPEDKVGDVMTLLNKKRGQLDNMEYLNNKSIRLLYKMPLAEMISDFYDTLKSVTSGYASLAYTFDSFVEAPVVKVDILVMNEVVDALSFMTHKDNAYKEGKIVAEKLKTIIPRAQFPIPIQAAIGATIIARETISAYRKDVTGHLYGGDISRKKKLLKKQKVGKKKMKQIGNVTLPQEAFLTLLQK